MSALLLRGEHLSLHFGGVKAVNDVSFQVRAGEIMGLGAAVLPFQLDVSKPEQIEALAEKSSFIEAAQLLIWGELPTETERRRFGKLLGDNSSLPEEMRRHFSAFPAHAHPMAILSAMINALQAYDLPGLNIDSAAEFEQVAASLLSKVRTIAAASYKSSIGDPIVYPRYDMKYAENFLHMMFTKPYKDYNPSPEVAHALNMMLVLHADHEQNCSTSTVRMDASSQANLYASAAAGVCALWGPLHGGANQAVIEMLGEIQRSGMSVQEYVGKVKDKSTGVKLMGFGHRVYRNFDPRASSTWHASWRPLPWPTTTSSSASSTPTSTSTRASS